MLNVLEKQIQRAASQGNWTTYKALYDFYTELNGGSVPKAKIAEIF